MVDQPMTPEQRQEEGIRRSAENGMCSAASTLVLLDRLASLRVRRDTLKRVCREGDQARYDRKQLRAALAAIRVKALPAGAAVGLQREGWEDRCREVLDIIDAALSSNGEG